MTLGINLTLRNGYLTDIRDAIDASLTAGKIKFYTGARPATGGTATTLLGTVRCSDPCAPNPTAGVLTFSAFADENNAAATGVATWGRITDGDDNFVFDCSVGKRFTEDGNTTAGSAVISNLPDTTKIDAGMHVSGAGIPDGATVVSVDSGTQVTLSVNATASAAAVPLTFQDDADILLNDTQISGGGIIRVNSGSITEGNA